MNIARLFCDKCNTLQIRQLVHRTISVDAANAAWSSSKGPRMTSIWCHNLSLHSVILILVELTFLQKLHKLQSHSVKVCIGNTAPWCRVWSMCRGLSSGHVHQTVLSDCPTWCGCYDVTHPSAAGQWVFVEDRCWCQPH